jgi:hypothetical protein
VFDFPYAVMMGRTVNPELRPTLDLNFRDNQDVGSDITYTGGANRTYFDANGVLTAGTTDVARFDHVLKSRTNHIRNNTMQGAVAGAPGTDPTNWTATAAGQTITINEIGTENGIDYIEYHFVGDASADFNVNFETSTGLDALINEVWTESLYLSIVSGDLTNLNSIKLLIKERNEAGGAKAEGSGSDIKASLTSTLQRFEFTRTLTHADTAHLIPFLQFDVTPTVAIDITLRIGLPQMERAAAATDAIKTYGGAVTVDEWRDHNLCLQSEAAQTTWLGVRNTISVDAIANPIDGAVTADGLVASLDSNNHRLQQTIAVIAGGKYVWSAYVKAGDKTVVFLTTEDTSPGSTTTTYFDISAGTIGTRGSTHTNAEIFDAENGWYRVAVGITSAGGDKIYCVAAADSDNDASFVGDASTIDAYLWGAQLTKGSELLDYTATTTTAVAATLEYVPVGLSVWEARTNILLDSEVFKAADGDWANTRVTINNNAIVAPDGTLTADTIVEDDGSATTHYIYQDIAHATFTDSTDYTYSAYFKAANRSWVAFQFKNTDDDTDRAYFDLVRGVVGNVSASATATISYVGDNWFRCSMTRDSGSGTTDARLYIVVGEADNDQSFDGLSQNSLYAWGTQLEKGAFPSPYVKTTTDEVDATADVATMSDASWHDITKGTFYWEQHVLTPNTGASRYAGWAEGSTTSIGTSFGILSSGSKVFGQTNPSGLYKSTATDSVSANVTQKAVIAYSASDMTVVIDGSVPVQDTTGGVQSDATTVFNIGSNHSGNNLFNGNIARITYWPHRLSDIALQNLTI